ncbi:poly [ADP-ribose] polymerase tankyrase-2-like isoform X2 [Branchiostoma floridae]|uniref:Poly [ADP-ribose] polymerase tankyrase-2-like isoform X2 n=1 Tax=Branchiostoma floridae TaxID=7739 RepID=A0A9J7LG12_BRAFL|nr:poly [ADP-ribose] polymerase tankyrase-2-like isoform X2 [Branchiostoma floridae]
MAVTDPNIDLFDAVRDGSLRGVDAALKAGADIDFEYACCEDSSPGTFLFNASCMGDVDTARLLLRKGASLVKRSTRSAFAPLHGAAFNGRTEIVDLLVQHGATVDVRDRCQNTPLMRACDHNHVDTVRRLLELGARPDLTGGHCRAIKSDENEESWKLIQEARKTKLLRCCNAKCSKPGKRKTGTLKLCGRCKLTRYCSRDCQKQHWSVGHKKCCGHDVYFEEIEDSFQRALRDIWHL